VIHRSKRLFEVFLELFEKEKHFEKHSMLLGWLMEESQLITNQKSASNYSVLKNQ
jgi:hypothetical protein